MKKSIFTVSSVAKFTIVGSSLLVLSACSNFEAAPSNATITPEQISAAKIKAEQVKAEQAANKTAIKTSDVVSVDKATAEKEAAEKVLAGKAAAEKQALVDQVAADKAAADKAAADKIVADKAAADKVLAEQTLAANTAVKAATAAANFTPTIIVKKKAEPRAPSSKFDLLGWSLSVPVDEDDNEKADQVKEKELSSGYFYPEFFYLDGEDGMVFKAPVNGAKTSKNTSYTRSELRGMLRRGDTDYSTKGVTPNNWVFSSAPEDDQEDAGGVDGTMDATLAVNYVTTTGAKSQVGRVVIGQIHANHDEPVRIYYRKLPGNTKGSIYYAHEPIVNQEVWIEMIGSKSSNAKNPVDGIELNEVFSYRINVVGNLLTVTIMRDGKPDVVSTTDMSDSGYDQGGQYMYFKAGVYNQNKTGLDDDYVEATFYNLTVSHGKYGELKEVEDKKQETEAKADEQSEDEDDDWGSDWAE